MIMLFAAAERCAPKKVAEMSKKVGEIRAFRKRMKNAKWLI